MLINLIKKIKRVSKVCYKTQKLKEKKYDFQNYMLLKITLTLDLCLKNPLERKGFHPLEINGANSSVIFGLIS